MKLLAQVEGLAVPATMAAVYDKDTLVTISGDRTVTKCVSNSTPIGRVTKPGRTGNLKGTVETRFKELIEIKFSGALSAGTKVKFAAADGTTGENVVAAWVSGTDAYERLVGVVWFGAADGAVGEVLTY